MSIADVQRAFLRGLDGNGSCKAATIDFENGGRLQRLSFHVVAGSYGAAYLSEAIPADMCPMQHARTMAASFLEGRITGQSRFVTAPAVVNQAPIVIQAASVPAPVAIAPATAPVTVQAPAPVAAKHDETPVSDAAHAELEALIHAGDIAGASDLICRWIDEEAGAIRAVWANDNPGQLLEYEQVRREINDLAYGLVQPSPSAFPCLWASVGVDVPRTGNDEADIRAAAALINDQIDATSDFLAQVRAVRLAAKKRVREAYDIEEALAFFESVQWPTA